MGAVWLRARSELRASRGVTVALVVLVALVGSMAMGAAIGARRTATVPDRLLAAVDGQIDVQILDLGEIPLTAIEDLPMVERASISRFLVVDSEMDVTTATDQLFGSQLVEGAIDPEDPTAAVLDGTAAEALGVGLGDEIPIETYSAEQWEAQDPSGGPQGPHVTAHVAAIVREPDDVDAADPKSVESLGSDASLSLPQSFLDRYSDVGVFTNVFTSIQLEGGAGDLDDFKKAVRELPGGEALQVLDAGDTRNYESTNRAVRLQALGLLGVAVALTLAGAMSVGQALVRLLRADSADAATLEALGMTGGQRFRVGLVRGAVIGSASAALAVMGAVAWSSLTPVGLAREGEPHPGVEANVTLLAAGGVVLVLLVTVAAGLSARSAPDVRDAGLSPADGGPRWSGPALALGRARAGAVLAAAIALTTGARSSRRAARATTLAIGSAVVLLVAGAVLVTSLDRVVERPQSYGWSFDAVGGNPFEEDPGELFDIVERTPGIESMAPAANITLDVEGTNVTVVAIEPVTDIAAKPIDGRAPASIEEIALGRRTLSTLDVEIGDQVEVDAGRGPIDMTVTGTVVVPELGGTGVGLGEGAVLTLEALQEVAPDVQPNLALLRFEPGQRDRAVAAFAELSEDTQPLVEPFLPVSLYQFVRIRSLPVLLGALVVMLALATLVLNVVGAGQTRRRELAVLKALGFTRRQVAASGLWQATWFTLVALTVGIPLGVAAGRLGWLRLGRRLGLADGPAIPVELLVVLVPVALVAANLAALSPASWRARRSPSRALRIE